TGLMLEKIEKVLIKEKPNIVIVYGDTNSTIAGAFAAVKLHIPTAHVEAGLRSYNRRMPEEINRIATDSISDILFAPTQTAMRYLDKEGLSEYSFFSGDVMYDSVLFYKNKIQNKKLSIDLPKKFYLATIHRPANTDNINNFKSIFKAFSTFDKNIIFPVHPRTRKILKEMTIPKNLIIIDPISYLDILQLIMKSDLIFTDSGGLQKECFFLKKRCVTLREETEWIETLENKCNILTGANTDKIVKAEKSECGDFFIEDKFGKGNSAEMIINKVLKFVGK
ncbi:MAG: UDP-N-acetylglucosamine 2-epimerase (non-hydrolyzing), partial [Patescibacteria group bacterium]|nr:UDP-N-acetylglucosamine 2-epimerase (non-hydrolyzing) [Patescibacteria group bacterium]